MSGFKDGATDLDSLFMLYQSGTKVPATGFLNGAEDLADRYQPYTTGTKRSNTGFVDGSTDIAQLFQNSSEPLIYILDPWWSGNLTAIEQQPAPEAKAGFHSFLSTGAFTRFATGGSTLDSWLSDVGTGNGSDFYIRRTSYSTSGSGQLQTNLTTSWQQFNTGSFYFYIIKDTLGTYEVTGLTISISPNASTTGEVTWTGNLSATLETAG